MKPSVAPANVVCLALGLLCASACDGGPPAASPGTATQGANGSAARKDAAFGFEARGGGASRGRPFPFALLEGAVAGKPTRFILDTGATTHTIDSAIAEAAQLKSPASASIITIEGWGSLPERPAAVVALSASLRAHGIGGIIAPQLLVEGGQAVVVDFVAKHMRLRPRSTAWSEVADVGPRLTPEGQGKACSAASASGGAPGMLLAVDGALEGETIRLALDTGAGRTTLDEGSKGGARAKAHPVLGRSIGSFTSGDVASDIHGGVPLTLGAWATTLDVGVAPGEPHPTCGYEGRLGIDALQQCALAFAEGDFIAACRAPGASGR